MANPTTTINEPARITTNGITPVEIPLNPDRFYEAVHRSVNEAGAAAPDAVFFTTDPLATPTATYASGSKRGTILSGDPPIPIGPGVSTLKLVTASGSPVIDVFPSGTVQR